MNNYSRDVFITGVDKKYPEEVLKDRVSIEGNVVSCLWKDPLLVDEVALESNDFITQDGRYYFSLAKFLRGKGFSSFDEVTVLSNLTQEVELGFNSRGGWDSIQHQIDIINTQNFDTYLDILYREKTILNMYIDGFNLTKSIDVNGKLTKPIDLFRRMTEEEVTDWYDSRLSSYNTGNSSKILEEGAIDFDDEFILSAEEGDECGVHFDYATENIDGKNISCFPFLSNQMGGILDGTFNIIAGYSSVGKSSYLVTQLMAMLEKGRKVLIFSNEQRIKVFKMNFLIWSLAKHFKYFNLTKNKFLSGERTEDDKKYIKMAQKWWRDHEYNKNLQFISISDANMPIVKKKIREYTLRYGFDYFVYDTMKLDFDNMSESKEYLDLIKDSRTFDSMAKKYNIIIVATLQMAIHTQGNLWCDASMFSQCKQIKEVCESIIIIRNTYPEELDEGCKKYYCQPYKLVKANDRWTPEKYEPDTSKVFRTLFLEKTRSGANSNDTGTAYLLSYDGSHCTFKEVCQCKPKHGRIGQ